jgi:pyruvate dehydrogenase E2 component (dihydrolipoamide acetyltransferase)
MRHYPMPSLGSGMTSGKVLEWYVEPGQVVRRGEVIGLVDTDKGAIEVEIWEDAEVEAILAPPGTQAPVGEPLLSLKPLGPEPPIARDEGPEEATEPEEAPGIFPPRIPTRVRASPAARKRAAELGVDLAEVKGTGPEGAVTLADMEAPGVGVGPSPRPPASEPTPPPPVPAPSPKPKATPVARQAAKVLGVDLEGLPGTGPGGAISRRDVEAAARGGGEPGPEVEPEREKRPPEDEFVDRHRAMRQAIAAAMSRSKKEIPHYYLATTALMENAARWLEETNRELPPAKRILPVALYLKAVALALGEYPELNGFWEEGAFRSGTGVHPGLAISLRGGGLVAPAIHDLPGKELDEITASVRDVVQRARVGRLRGSEVTDPTITVTSLGDRGVDTVFGVIYPPQVAIVGVGTVVERPWAEEGMVGARRTVNLTLAADHRASDGHRGGLFLERVARLLQAPEKL